MYAWEIQLARGLRMVTLSFRRYISALWGWWGSSEPVYFMEQDSTEPSPPSDIYIGQAHSRLRSLGHHSKLSGLSVTFIRALSSGSKGEAQTSRGQLVAFENLGS